jgi:hypothetical protein
MVTALGSSMGSASCPNSGTSRTELSSLRMGTRWLTHFKTPARHIAQRNKLKINSPEAMRESLACAPALAHEKQHTGNTAGHLQALQFIGYLVEQQCLQVFKFKESDPIPSQRLWIASLSPP